MSGGDPSLSAGFARGQADALWLETRDRFDRLGREGAGNLPRGKFYRFSCSTNFCRNLATLGAITTWQ